MRGMKTSAWNTVCGTVVLTKHTRGGDTAVPSRSPILRAEAIELILLVLSVENIQPENSQRLLHRTFISPPIRPFTSRCFGIIDIRPSLSGKLS